MPADLLLLLAVIAAMVFLSPCSPYAVWKRGSCALRPPTETPDDRERRP